MLIFDYNEFSRDMAKVFNAALREEVIITTKDGNSYKLLPIKENEKSGTSPLENIPRIKLDITTQEIVEILHECRAEL
jgi:hypothetical protein